jgi:hypothetical protein
MFPTDDWDLPPTLGWENPPKSPSSGDFLQFSGIGTFLD